MAPPKPLTADSGPQAVISSLRRRVMLGTIPVLTTALPYTNLLPNPLHAHLEAAHVFTFGQLLDGPSDKSLSLEQVEELNTVMHRMYAGPGLSLPFPQTVFIEFSSQSQIWFVIYLEQDETEIHGWVFSYLFDKRDWCWDGHITLLRHREVAPKARGMPSEKDGGVQFAHRAGLSIVGGLTLLSLQGRAVFLEPAESVLIPGKPKAFERPNPSVSLLRVNTPQLRYTRPSEPTGITMRPHDRRGHYRQCGNRLIWVRDTKIHGGAASPTAKIVAYAKPIPE